MEVTTQIREIQKKLRKEIPEDSEITGISFEITDENLAILEKEAWGIWGYLNSQDTIVVIDTFEEELDLVTLPDKHRNCYIPYEIVNGILQISENPIDKD